MVINICVVLSLCVLTMKRSVTLELTVLTSVMNQTVQVCCLVAVDIRQIVIKISKNDMLLSLGYSAGDNKKLSM